MEHTRYLRSDVTLTELVGYTGQASWQHQVRVLAKICVTPDMPSKHSSAKSIDPPLMRAADNSNPQRVGQLALRRAFPCICDHQSNIDSEDQI